MAPPDPDPLPEGWLLRPTAGLRVSNDWTILVGGSPTTLVRVSSVGGRTLKRLFAGEPLGPSHAERSLARRLEVNGMAWASPPSDVAATALDRCTIIIPYFNDREGLDRTLAALNPSASPRPIDVIIVDDNSTPRLQLERERTTVLRHERNRGPAAARNTGSNAATTDVLVFLDAGAEIDPETLAQLVSHLDDPHTCAVAPRIRASPGASAVISAYERSRSPLDLGDAPALARSLSAVPYVPSTCLAVRTSEFHKVGGFADHLRFGEDVDLVWRITARGAVRYAADLHAIHPARNTLSSFVRQRLNYGRSAARLAQRHPDATTPLVLERWSSAALALSAAGFPIALPAVVAYRANALTSALPQDLEARSAVAASIVVKGQVSMVAGMAKSLARPYGPLTGLGLVATHTHPVTLICALGMARLISHRRPAPAALSIVDDAAYSAGVWENAIRQRSWRCLIPRLT